MSCQSNSSDINQTFIIEAITNSADTITACSGVYTNEIISCSGNTTISLGTGIINFNNNIQVNGSISGNTFSADTYYSGGTNLLDIFTAIDNYVTGGTFNNISETLTLSRKDGVSLSITGFTDFYTTGGTLINDTIYFDRTDTLSAYTINLSGIVLTDTYVTGGTFDTLTRILTLTKNDNVNISISGFSDTFTTGATYTGGYVYFDRNDVLSAYTLDLTAISGDSNTFVTGGTLSGNTLVLERNDNAQVNIDLTDIRFSGGSGNCITDFYVTNIYGCSAVTIYSPVTLLSGLTINLPTQDNLQTQIIVRDSGSGEIKYRDVQSIISAATSQDIFVTGLTFSSNLLTISRNDNVSFSTLLDNFSGLTINGNLTVTGDTTFNSITANTISATTYYGLPVNTDIFVTGGTYYPTSGLTTFINNTGGTFDVSGFFKPTDDIFSTGFTYNAGTYDLTITRNDGISLVANVGLLASDVTITGGTYNINTGVVTFTNNTGGTFSVSGFTSGMTDTTILSYTYNNNVFTIADSTGGTFNALFNSVTGLTVNGNLTVTGNTNVNSIVANSLSATTYLGLPTDIYVTGGTYNTGTATFKNNTGGTFNVSGFFTGNTDVYVTGGTYNSTTDTITFRNNTGGTFTVTGITDIYTTGTTLIDTTIYFNRNDGLSAYTADIGQLLVWISGSTGISSVRVNNITGLDATGDYSVAEGWNSLASGDYSHSEGNITTASGDASHSEGSGTLAIGVGGHAEGNFTTARGDNSHTEGYNTTATGLNAHAEGWMTKASGAQSHAEGVNTLAQGDNSHVGGGANIFLTGKVKAIGDASFNHSYVSINEPISGASGNYSAILGGINQNIFVGATNSAILGGSGNTINSNVVNSIVLGGYGITTLVSNMVYVPKLNLYSGLTNDNTLTSVLVRASDGEVKYRTVQSIIDSVSGATSGATITAFTYNDANTFILNRNDGLSFSATFTTVTGLTTSGNISPLTDNTSDLGGNVIVTDNRFTGATTTGATSAWTHTVIGTRFRNINTVSGTSSVWTSTYSVNTPNLNLGLDSSGITRTITANNSIIQDDVLLGGTF